MRTPSRILKECALRILTGRTEENDGMLCFEIAKDISNPQFREEHGINDRIAMGILFHCSFNMKSLGLYKYLTIWTVALIYKKFIASWWKNLIKNKSVKIRSFQLL